MFTKRQAFLGAVLVMLVTFVLTIGGVLYLLNAATGNAAQTIKFFSVFYTLRTKYVEAVPDEKLINGAIDGMVKSTGDPHTVYMQGEMLRQFMTETEGNFGGVGIIVGSKDDTLTVVAPIEDTPGHAAGIKSGDKIITIDGEDTKGMPLDVAVNKIRGPKETTVSLGLLGEDGQKRTVEVVRSDIKLKTVYGRKIEDNIGYIRVTMFNKQTDEDFAAKLKEFDQENITKIVLDLRNNPGGLLDSCIAMARMIVPKGPIVSIVTKDGSKEVYSSDLVTPKYKFVVLVNQGSASASEIIAGALQDTKTGIILGKNTYGKGSVQTVMQLDADSALKLTFATYYTPNNNKINGVGVKPDVELELVEGEDNQLAKAISLLKEQN